MVEMLVEDGGKNLFAGVVRGRPDKDSLLGPLWAGEGPSHDPIYADVVEARHQTKSPIK